MKKIAIIIPYFGRFKPDFKFFLKSAEWNPTVDFIFFTNDIIQSPPQNVKVITTSFEDIVRKFQNYFNFKIALYKPYKLCDFKPTYGDVFHDYLVGYDFWGYCDIDLILGDIRSYITDELLEQYDRIFGLGHLSLYRNNKTINSRYKEGGQPSYKQVYSFKEYSGFDEYWGTSRYWDINYKEDFYQNSLFDDVDCNDYPFHAHKKRNIDSERSNFIYSFEKGKVFRIFIEDNQINKEETLYVHFQKREMTIQTDVSDYFMMVPNAFIPYIEHLDILALRRYDVSKKIYLKRFQLFKQRVLNKIAKMIASISPSIYGVPRLPKDARHYYNDECELNNI